MPMLPRENDQRQHVEHDARADDERHEAEVAAERPQAGAKPHRPGLRRPQL